MIKLFHKRVKKEIPRKQRIVRNFIISLFVLACIICSYVCFFHQVENPYLAWWSNLLINMAVATAITAIFLYISEVRLRRFRLQEALGNLRRLIYNIYSSIGDMESGSQEKKQNQFQYFVSCSQYIKIDISIIESDKPKLYKAIIDDFLLSSEEYKLEVLKQSNCELTNTGEIININFPNGLNINSNIKEFIKNLRESCNRVEKLLG